VLILTGPSSAGKTTVARRLVEESTEPSVHLHSDDFFKALKAGRLRGWVAGAEPQHEVVFEAIGSAAGSYAAGGYFVVVDTLVRRLYLDILIHTILRRNVSVDLVVLRPSFAEVLARSVSAILRIGTNTTVSTDSPDTLTSSTISMPTSSTILITLRARRSMQSGLGSFGSNPPTTAKRSRHLISGTSHHGFPCGHSGSQSGNDPISTGWGSITGRPSRRGSARVTSRP
jgi:Chloramphenicol phosphotransferase-like protein